MSSSNSKLVVPEIGVGSSVPELMAFARSSFRQEDFDEVERLLIAHEEMLETEFRNLKRDYEQMVKECELLKEGNDALKIENLELKEELKKHMIEFEELRQQLISLEIEKNRIIEGLTGEKREAEEMVAMRDSRLMDVDMRLLNLEELVAQIMRVPVEILRSGAFVAGVRMNVDVPVHEVQNGGNNMGNFQNGVIDHVEVSANGADIPVHESQNVGINLENFQNGVLNHEEVSANGVNIPVHDGQNGGIDMESFQNGVIDHVEGENGDFSLENLNNESDDDFENSQTLELFLSIQQHFACSMTGNQGSDLPIEGNGNVNAEASSGAQSTSDCPQVESVACDMEKDNDESPDTDFNDKELLRNNVRMLNSHNVVLFSCDVQSVCDTPQIGFNSFRRGKEKKMLKAAAGSAHVSVSCASEVYSIGKKMPFIISGESAWFVGAEENGIDGIKDSRIHLMPKRKRSMTGTNGTLHDEKGSLGNDNSLKLDLKSASCQEPN